MKSQTQKKKERKKMNYGITNTNIFPIKKFLMRGKNFFWAKKLWGGCSKLED